MKGRVLEADGEELFRIGRIALSAKGQVRLPTRANFALHAGEIVGIAIVVSKSLPDQDPSRNLLSVLGKRLSTARIAASAAAASPSAIASITWAWASMSASSTPGSARGNAKYQKRAPMFRSVAEWRSIMRLPVACANAR